MAVIDRALSLGGHASGVRIQPGAQKTGRKEGLEVRVLFELFKYM